MTGDILVSFNYIKSLFNDDWDLGVLSPELFHRANLAPVKTKFHKHDIHEEDYANNIHFRKETNVLVLIRNGSIWDYSHYEEAMQILKDGGLTDCYSVYTNFKEASILAGLAVRAKNSLVYSYKFGFDCHITAARFEQEIIDLPTDKRVNYKIWNRCIGCDDCAKACPVGAIHNDSKNQFEWWMDSSKCDNFIGYSNHEIPSIKKYWHENVYPELSDEHVNNVTDFLSAIKPMSEGGLSGMPWDRNGYTYDGQNVKKDGVSVDIPVCRECTSQPRCSKWNGRYKYVKD